MNFTVKDEYNFNSTITSENTDELREKQKVYPGVIPTVNPEYMFRRNSPPTFSLSGDDEILAEYFQKKFKQDNNELTISPDSFETIKALWVAYSSGAQIEPSLNPMTVRYLVNRKSIPLKFWKNKTGNDYVLRAVLLLLRHSDALSKNQLVRYNKRRLKILLKMNGCQFVNGKISVPENFLK